MLTVDLSKGRPVSGRKMDKSKKYSIFELFCVLIVCLKCPCCIGFSGYALQVTDSIEPPAEEKSGKAQVI